MGGCVSKDDKKPIKPPPTKEELGGSGGQLGSAASPNNVNVQIVDQGRPLPSTPLRKGILCKH